MIKEIIMPKAGMDMQEGQIIKWNFSEGDYVEKGNILLEIMTDKVGMEVEAEESGILLKILFNEGDTVPVITVIGYIGDEKDKAEVNNLTKNNMNKDINYKKENKKNGEEYKLNSNLNEINNTMSKINRRATPAAKKLLMN